ALAAPRPLRVVRLTEALRGLAWHQHLSALLRLRGNGRPCRGRLAGTGRRARGAGPFPGRGPARVGTRRGGAGSARTAAARPVGTVTTTSGGGFGRGLPTRHRFALVDP